MYIPSTQNASFILFIYIHNIRLTYTWDSAILSNINETEVVMRKNIDISSAAQKGLELAVEKKEGANVKWLMEKAVEKYAHPFIRECAKEQGLTLKQFIEACEKGEF